MITTTIKIKIQKEDLLIIHNALHNPLVAVKVGEILGKNNIVEWYKSIFAEVGITIGKKCFTSSKMATFEFYKHSATVFYWILEAILEINFLPIYERNQIDKLKNELHQKKLIL